MGSDRAEWNHLRELPRNRTRPLGGRRPHRDRPACRQLTATSDRVRSPYVLAYTHEIGLGPGAIVGDDRGPDCLPNLCIPILVQMSPLVGNLRDVPEQPRTAVSVARGHSAADVRRLLAVIPMLRSTARSSGSALSASPSKPPG